jgi:hypothetical protein
VISFLVPHNGNKNNNQDRVPSKGIVDNIINFFRYPWNRAPQDPTSYSQFPPFLEYYAQRIQAYFSIYKYSDESRHNNTIVLLPAANDEVQEEITTITDADMITTMVNDSEIEDLTTEMPSTNVL